MAARDLKSATTRESDTIGSAVSRERALVAETFDGRRMNVSLASDNLHHNDNTQKSTEFQRRGSIGSFDESKARVTLASIRLLNWQTRINLLPRIVLVVDSAAVRVSCLRKMNRPMAI